MARLGVAPHIADKILNHKSGSIWGWQRYINATSLWTSDGAQAISGAITCIAF